MAMNNAVSEPNVEALPLTGVRVIDLSIWVQGPLAAMMLADLGAEVIKIEKPGQGDFARGTKTIFGRDQTLPNGRGLMYEIANRNKRAVSVDLKSPQGRRLFHRLIEVSQVLVTNLHPSALQEFGADRDTLSAVNPNLIHASATGYGTEGPAALDPCQDTTGMARSGFMFAQAGPEAPPAYPVGTLSDVLSGTMLAFAVLAAILEQRRTGRARAVTCSQLSAMMWLQYYSIAQYANQGLSFMPHRREAAVNPLVNLYRCEDGKWLACGMFLSGRFIWEEFCAVMELPQLAADPRFKDDNGRIQHNRELIAHLDRAFARYPRDHWEQTFRDRGYWASVVNRIEDLPEDPQVISNRYITADDAGLKMVGFPFNFIGGLARPPRHAPRFGDDTDEILQELAGVSAEELISLKLSGVVW